MRKWMQMLRPGPLVWRRLAMVVVVAGVGVGAFCWGRQGAVSQADAQQPDAGANRVGATPGADTTDYQRRVVAYLYDNVPVTREELGEYLIARFGGERVEFLVNRKIVEMACQARGVTITDAEVEAQFKTDLRQFGPHMTEKDFVNQVLKRFNKSLYEWKEDVLRPKIAMQKLVRATFGESLRATNEEIIKGYEARFGAKVQCRMIALQKELSDRARIETWERVSKSEEAFNEQAKQQFIPDLAAKGGEVPPIHMHFADSKLEKEAFALQPGQVSSLIQLQDGTWVILRCEKRIAADNSKRVEDVRMDLAQEISERKLALKIPELFTELRTKARPRVLIANPNQQQLAAITSPDPAPAASAASAPDRPLPPVPDLPPVPAPTTTPAPGTN